MPVTVAVYALAGSVVPVAWASTEIEEPCGPAGSSRTVPETVAPAAMATSAAHGAGAGDLNVGDDGAGVTVGVHDK